MPKREHDNCGGYSKKKRTLEAYDGRRVLEAVEFSHVPI